MDPETTPVPTPKKSNTGLIVLVIVIVILLVGVFAHMRDGERTDDVMPTGDTTADDSMNEPTIPPPTQSSPAVSTSTTVQLPTTVPATKSFTIEASNFSFNPAAIQVNKGDKVSITLVNKNGFHDLVIDGYNVKTNGVNSGQTATVTFVADKVGTFEYYCSVGNHRQMGMKGTLIVK